MCEKRSKVDFPISLSGVSTVAGAKSHRLVGFGLRTKTWFDVKVYAMTLHLDPTTTLPALSEWKGKDSDPIQSSTAVYETILKPASGKTLRLVMRRGVDGDDMRTAFEDALEPRMKRAQKEFKMPGSAAALKLFRSFFDVDELKKGQVLNFTWHPASATTPGHLQTRVNRVV